MYVNVVRQYSLFSLAYIQVKVIQTKLPFFLCSVSVTIQKGSNIVSVCR